MSGVSNCASSGISSAPQHDSNNLFNIGMTCDHFGMLTPRTYARALPPTVMRKARGSGDGPSRLAG